MNILCIDIGGTAMKSGIIEDGILKDKKECNSNGAFGADSVLEALYSLIETYSGYEAIGICTTGQVDTVAGTIVAENENIPNYKGLQIAEIIGNKYHVPVWVENDVNAAAIGEGNYGCAKGIDSFLCLTYGTGIGAAIIEKNQLIPGSMGFAGEVGHMIIHGGGKACNCGYCGCYEAYASVTALIQMAQEYDSTIHNGKLLFEQINMGNETLLIILNQWIDEISYGLISLIHTFNPSHIVLGGGIIKQNQIIEALREKLSHRLMDGFGHVQLLQASLGNDAGLYGMAHIVTSNHISTT